MILLAGIHSCPGEVMNLDEGKEEAYDSCSWSDFVTIAYPTDTVEERNRETIDAVVSSKPYFSRRSLSEDGVDENRSM